MSTENERAKRALAIGAKALADIDAEMQRLVDLLVEEKITPTLAAVQEINLRKRRETIEKMYNSINATIKHF